MVRYNGLVWSNIAVLNFSHPIHMILEESIYDKSFHQGTIVNIVEDCDISYTDLTQEQVEHIFDEMLRRTRLKKLNIRGNSLR